MILLKFIKFDLTQLKNHIIFGSAPTLPFWSILGIIFWVYFAFTIPKDFVEFILTTQFQLGLIALFLCFGAILGFLAKGYKVDKFWNQSSKNWYIYKTLRNVFLVLVCLNILTIPITQFLPFSYYLWQIIGVLFGYFMGHKLFQSWVWYLIFGVIIFAISKFEIKLNDLYILPFLIFGVVLNIPKFEIYSPKITSQKQAWQIILFSILRYGSLISAVLIVLVSRDFGHNSWVLMYLFLLLDLQTIHRLATENNKKFLYFWVQTIFLSLVITFLLIFKASIEVLLLYILVAIIGNWAKLGNVLQIFGAILFLFFYQFLLQNQLQTIFGDNFWISIPASFGLFIYFLWQKLFYKL